VLTRQRARRGALAAGALAAVALLTAAPAAADCVNACYWNCYQLTGRYGPGDPFSPTSRCIAACEYLNCPVPPGAFR
jgi:hypothetical protein